MDSSLTDIPAIQNLYEGMQPVLRQAGDAVVTGGLTALLTAGVKSLMPGRDISGELGNGANYAIGVAAAAASLIPGVNVSPWLLENAIKFTPAYANAGNIAKTVLETIGAAPIGAAATGAGWTIVDSALDAGSGVTTAQPRRFINGAYWGLVTAPVLYGISQYLAR